MAIAAEILTVLRADAHQFSAEMTAAEGSTQRFADSTSKMQAIGGAALLGLGAVAVGVAVISVKAAQDYEVAHASLTAAVKASGEVWSAQAGKVEEVDSKLRNLGFTDTQTEGSLTKLVVATHSVADGAKLMGLAADIARGRHIDLAAATDILVKVETGHVGLLGRIGLATKDATGATISQQQALQELTDKYGGQASAFAGTFAGKLQVLEAQLDHIAVAIGERLIPILETMLSTGVAVFEFLDHNREVALALAIIIGGPLVAAMLSYVAAQAAAAGTALLDFWGSLIGRAVVLVSSYEAVDVALAEDTVALLVAAGATEAEAVALLNLEGAATGAGAALLATLGPVGVLIAIGAGAIAIIDSMGSSIDGWRQKGEAAAKSQVASAEGSGHALKELQSGFNATGDKIDALNKKLHESADGLNGTGAGVTHYRQELAFLQGQHDSFGKALDDTRKKLSDQKAAHEELVSAAGATAKAYGLTIPAAAALSTPELKALQGEVAFLSTTMSQDGVQGVLKLAGALPDLGTALQGAQTAADNFAKSIEQSITDATDPFSHFASATAVSTQDLANFFVGSQLQAAAWANEITDLIHRGVSQGIIDEIAKAGPGSKPALDAFVALVDQNGVAWVNSVSQAGQQAAAVTEQAYSDMAVAVAIKTAEAAAVGKAFFADLEEGGHAHLSALQGTGDATFDHMLATAQAKLPRMTNAFEDWATNSIGQAVRTANGVNSAIGTIPDNTGKHVTVSADTFVLDQLTQQLGYLTSHEWAVAVTIQGNTSLAAVTGSSRTIKYNVVPVG